MADMVLLKNITLPGTASNALQAIHKGYVDAAIAAITGGGGGGGAAATAAALATARNIGLTGVTATPALFDGTQNVNIAITSIPTSILAGTIPTSMVTNLDTTLSSIQTQQSTNTTAIQSLGTRTTTLENDFSTLNKASVGLGNVDNTSDINKPVSTATQTALTGLQTQITANNAGFVFDQATAAAVWTVNHGLNRHPSVTVIDSAGTIVMAMIGYVDVNNVTISAAYAFSGQAFFN